MDIYDVILLSDRTEDGIRKASFQTCDMVCSSRLSGIDCHARGTSCPDQLARALKALNTLQA